MPLFVISINLARAQYELEDLLFGQLLLFFRKTNRELREPGPESMPPLKQKTSVEEQEVKEKTETQEVTNVLYKSQTDRQQKEKKIGEKDPHRN